MLTHRMDIGLCLLNLHHKTARKRSSNHQAYHESGHESKQRHTLTMTLYCLLPIIVVAVAFPVFPGTPRLGALVLMLRPLAMLMMHLPEMLWRKKKSEKHEHQDQRDR